MNCPKCNHVNDDNAVFCSVCSAALRPEQSYMGTQQNPNASPQGQHGNYNPGYNHTNVYNYNFGYPMPNPNDNPSILLNILGFLFPVLGLIIYFIVKGKNPRKGKSLLTSVLISIILSIIGTVFLSFLVSAQLVG